MDKIAFITAYDSYALGMRILSKMALKKFDVKLFYFKEENTTQIDTIELDKHAHIISKNNGRLYATTYHGDPFSDHEMNTLINEIVNYAPHIIALSARSFLDDFAIKIISLVKERMQHSFIAICGGYGPSMNHRKYMPYFDYVFYGESESSFQFFMEAYPDKKEMSKTPSIYYNCDGIIIKNTPGKIHEMNFSNRFPLLSNSKSVIVSGVKPKYYDPISDSEIYNTLYGRGCIGKCSFCSAGSAWCKIHSAEGISVKTRRNRTHDDILTEIEEAIEFNPSISNIRFVDSYLMDSVKQMSAFFHKYKERINLPFTTYFHPSQFLANEWLLDEAKSAGFVQCSIGVQTGSQSFASDIYNRTYTNKMIIDFANLLLTKQIDTCYHFIGGCELESEDTINEDHELIKHLPKDPKKTTIGVNKLVILPGTEIEEKCKNCHNNYSLHEFEYQSALKFHRFWADDVSFNEVRNSEYFKKNPHEIKHAVLNAFFSYHLRKGITFRHTEQFSKYYAFFLKNVKPRHLIIWGAGGFLSKNSKLIINRSVTLVDGNKSLHGIKRYGIEVKSPFSIPKDSTDPIFIFSVYKQEIEKTIKKIGLTNLLV